MRYILFALVLSLTGCASVKMTVNVNYNFKSPEYGDLTVGWSASR